jgi:dynein heavy chain
MKFTRGNLVCGLESSEGEPFELLAPQHADGPVEKWMTLVEAEMKRSLKDVMKRGVFSFADTPNRIDWIKRELGMVAIFGSQIWWTWEVEDTFRKVAAGSKRAMKQLAGKLSRQLLDLIAAVREPGLTKKLRRKINALIIVEVHARDIIDRFVRDSILDAREFDWESQLRFYWDRAADDLVVRQCSGEFGYGYEYMGLSGRLPC